MSPRRALRPIIVLLLAAVAGTGCYTVLRHPEAEPWSSTYSSGTDQEYRGDDSGFFYGWTDPYYTSLYDGFPPEWGYYYYHPWTATGPWWCDPWYPWHPWDPDGGTPAPVTGGRHAWDRGPGAPTSGAGIGSVPGTSRTPSVAGSPATPTAPAGPEAAAPDTTRRTERRPDPARSADDPPRNAWGR
jgi:hypothetical protein